MADKGITDKRRAATERRWAFVVDALFFGIIIGLFYFFAKPAMSVIFPFLLAFLVGMVLQRPVNFLVRKTHIPKGVVSTVIVLLVASAIITLLVFVGIRIINEFKSFFDYLSAQAEGMDFKEMIESWLANFIKFLPDKLEAKVGAYINSVIESIGTSTASTASSSSSSSSSSSGVNWSSLLSSPLSGVFNTAKQIPSYVVAVIVSIVSCCFITTGYTGIRDFIFRQMSQEKGQKLRDAKRIAVYSMRKMGKAYLLIMGVTAVEMYVGLTILSIIGVYTGGFIIVIALLTCVIDILPVLGSGTVLIPWALYSLFTGSVGLGIGLIVLYAVITVVRQIIEPKLVAGQVGLSPVVAIMAMYVGAKVLGPLGIFILPLTVILLKLMNDEGVIHLFKNKPEPQTAEGDVKTDPPAENSPAEGPDKDTAGAGSSPEAIKQDDTKTDDAKPDEAKAEGSDPDKKTKAEKKRDGKKNKRA